MIWNYKERKKQNMLKFRIERRALKELCKDKEQVEVEIRDSRILKHTIPS
jgi:hypothetical protein